MRSRRPTKSSVMTMTTPGGPTDDPSLRAMGTRRLDTAAFLPARKPLGGKVPQSHIRRDGEGDHFPSRLLLDCQGDLYLADTISLPTPRRGRGDRRPGDRPL